MNYKRFIFYIFILFHVAAFTLIAIYSNKTQAVCEIEIISNHESKVICSTPVGNEISHTLLPKDTLLLSIRPWQNIEIFYKNKSEKLDLNSKSRITNYCCNKNISYKILKKSDNTFLGVLNFFFTTYPWLWPLYFIGLLTFIFILILLKNNRITPARHIKMQIYRWLLRSKSRQTDNDSGIIKTKRYQSVWMLILSILMIFVLYMNLSKYPFGQSAEEKRRALVSLEMKINNNYVVPTTNGENYLNKPPLFNWLLVPVIQNENVEAYTRAISVSTLIILSFVVFLLLRKDRGWQHALLVSIFFIGSWHVLSYVSFMTNVDALFSLFLILIFYLNFHFASKESYLKMYIIGYILFVLAFLTKGLPAIWFFGLSLFLSLFIHKKLKVLFSWQHLTGIGIAFVLLSIYWVTYSLYADPTPYFKQMFNEVIIGNKYNLSEKIRHILTFPFENIKAFRPISILFPCIFFRKNLLKIIKNKELTYLFLLFMLGSVVFLTSPYYRPYYILMFVPIIVDLILSSTSSFKNHKLTESLKLPLFLFLIFVPFWIINSPENIGGKILIIFLGAIFAIFRKYTISIMLLLVTIIVFIKAFGDMGYYTDNYDFNTPTREDCKRIVSERPGNIAIIKEADLINYVSVFYLTYFSNQIIPLVETVENKEMLYLTTTPEKYENYQISDSIQQYVWVFAPSKKSKGKNTYKPLYLISIEQ